MDENTDWLETWCRESRTAFEANHRIKSFGAFLEDLRAEPYLRSRNASQYLLDMMEHFGTRPVQVMGRTLPRFKVFDAPFDGHSDPPICGQEEPVLEIHGALRNLVSEGRADRILHLHGPNGSAKSLLVELLMKGCEAYSDTPEGARYTFAWVFPSGEDDRTLGFGGGSGEPPPEHSGEISFAHLPADRLEARIPCDAADSPLLLIPRERRLAFLKELMANASEEDRRRFVPTRFVDDGDLCPRCRMICDALIEEYRGDMAAVLRHVQVRRTFISRRYRRGAVVISPQDTPDASSRQITLDASLSSLPRALQHLNLVQLEGDLIDANNGLVEFSAFLTRAPEMNKYLLAATERGELTLPNSNVYLDTVLFATSNERHLEAFKQSPDFSSFKGRSFLIPVPYLLERRKESEVYAPILGRIGRIKHVGPHVGALAAHWAVLTRLHRPDPSRSHPQIRSQCSSIT